MVSAAVLILAVAVFAGTRGPLMPVQDGTYSQWAVSGGGSTHYTRVDDNPCNGLTDYVYTSSTGKRDSYQLDISSLPVSSTITGILISPCASRYNASSSSPSLDVFYIFEGTKSADNGHYNPPEGTPIQLFTFSFLGLNYVVHTTSTLEVGIVYTSGTPPAELRVSNVSTTIIYSPP